MATTHLLIDLAGVLARFDHAPRLAALARLSGVEEPEVETHLYASGFVDLADEGAVDADGVRRGLRERLGGLADADDADLDAAWMAAFAPDEEALAVIDAVRPPLVVALLSNNDALVADLLGEHLPEVARRLDAAFLSGALGVVKPEPEAFAAALELLGVAAAAVLFVDDSAANVEGARAAGLDAVLFTGPGALRAALAERGLSPQAQD